MTKPKTGRPKLNEAQLTLSPEMEHWFNTRGKELEQRFIATLGWSMQQARMRGIKYSSINVEQLLEYLRANRTKGA